MAKKDTGGAQAGSTGFGASDKIPDALREAGRRAAELARNPVARSLLGPKASEAAFRRLVESMSRLHKESYIKSIEASVRMDPRSDLANIKVPTLVVVGADDRLTPPDVSREIAAEIPGSELAVIPDAGHLVNIEQPEAFNAAVLDFLRKHSKRSS